MAGDNTFGQLGNGMTLTLNYVSNIWRNAHHVQAGTQWRSVLALDEHTVAVRQDGSLWAWGNNAVGQIGSAALFPSQVAVSTPRQVLSLGWRTVSTSRTHTVAVR